MSTRQKQRQSAGKTSSASHLMRESTTLPAAGSHTQTATPTQSRNTVPSHQSQNTQFTQQTMMTSTHAHPSADRSGREDERRKKLAFMLFAGALSLAAIASTLGEFEARPSKPGQVSLDPNSKTMADVFQGPRPKTYDERVLDHKNATGYKMNRDRIRVRNENLNVAPLEGEPVAASRRDPILHGLPLQPERHPYGLQAEPGYEPSLESSIQSSIQADRDAEVRLQREREAYIEEFKANAAAMGYKVKIDKNFNVEYAPMSEAEKAVFRSQTGDSYGGAAD